GLPPGRRKSLALRIESSSPCCATRAGFRVLDAADPRDTREWLDLWTAWPAREIFAHPEYVRLYASQGSHPMCAVWTSRTLQVLHPFLIRDLKREPFWADSASPAFDLTSAYGYAGPFVWGDGDRPGVARDFWNEFRRWALDHNVVCEFVRSS